MTPTLTTTDAVSDLERQLALPPPDPRHDKGLAERVVNDLLAHHGERRVITQLFGIDCWLARECVEVARRVGLVVEGCRPLPGYVLVGWRRPKPWTHLEKLDELLALSIARHQQQGAHRQMPGQLSLW